MVPYQRGKTGLVRLRSAGQSNVILLIRARRVSHPRHRCADRPKRLICVIWTQHENHSSSALRKKVKSSFFTIWRQTRLCKLWLSGHRKQNLNILHTITHNLQFMYTVKQGLKTLSSSLQVNGYLCNAFLLFFYLETINLLNGFGGAI